MHMAFCHRNPKQCRYVLSLIAKLVASFSDLRRTGSAAYDLSCIAAGRCECFFEPCLHIYDYAAGAVILKEAGGRFTDLRKDRNPIETGCILASNGHLHELLCTLLTTEEIDLLDD